MGGAQDIPHNNLLRLLKAADRDLLLPRLEPMQVTAGDVLYEPGDDVAFVHFPEGPALISFMVAFEDGNSVECALIGREGAVGGIVSHGQLPAYTRTVVQYPGTLWRMDTRRLHEAKDQSPAVEQLFNRYADCLLAQIFQSVACSAAHSIEQRTARWLLSAQDRTGDERVPITQQRLAELLGVGRSYVSRVLSGLKLAKAVTVSTGCIEILDRKRLDRHACNCTDSIRAHFDQVLARVYPHDGG